MTGSPKKALQGGGGGDIRKSQQHTRGRNVYGGEMSMGEKLGKTYVYCYLDIISIVLWIL